MNFTIHWGSCLSYSGQKSKRRKTMFELKRLSADAIPAALEKALRYRLLNDPAEAESICHDVLRIVPRISRP